MTKKWVVNKEIPEEAEKELEAYPPLARQLLFYRDIKSAGVAEKFFNPDYERDMHDPFLMLGMEKSVLRILKAIESNEKIVVFGDYDADGISGCVIFYDFFRKIGFENFHIHIPNRYKDGYGLTLGAIDEFIEGGIDLIITVDCGITDAPEVKKAKDAGIDTIIIDHHIVQDGAPEAYAIIDAKQKGETYPFKFLSGAGAAFKTVQALVRRGTEIGQFNIVKGWEKWLLDVASIATVADMVSLRDENRTIVHFGLKVLHRAKRTGLASLYKKLKLNSEYLNEDDIGFMVAPRINTASRMGHATTSFNLLITESEEEAKAIASDLEEKNGDRKESVQVILDAVEGKFTGKEDTIPPIIVLGDFSWMPGVLGLAANRIMEKYQRPVFLWGKADAHEIKGSCRSNGTIDLVKFMESVSDLFIGFGGHAMAGGFSVAPEKLDSLEVEAMEAYKKVEKMENGLAMLEIDSKLSLDDINWKNWNIIEKFAPFGMDNPKPVFIFEGVEVKEVKMFGNGGIHLELSFTKTKGDTVKAIGFFMTIDKFNDLTIKEGKNIDLVATMEKSMFRGVPELRLRIVDIREAV